MPRRGRLIGSRSGSNDARVGVLRGVFQSCSKASTSVSASWLTKCSSSHSRSSCAVCASSSISRAQMVVLAIEQRQRDDFIDRHDLRVAQRGGEQLAELVERRLDPLAAPRCRRSR